MQIKPVLTEKSMLAAKKGVYTFAVGKQFIKTQIKQMIGQLFNVHVKSVKVINYKGGVKKNFRGNKVTIKAYKKVMLTLGDKEKIDLFTEKK
ncbi:MAG: 50S ribosomal protein L23 [Candidatus Microgenomates bacterium]|jgi:large subunit ribosomal protein L23